MSYSTRGLIFLSSALAIAMGAGIIDSPTTSATTACIDATNYKNIAITVNEPMTKAIVSLKGDGVPCADVTVNLSSYQLPDNYNGKGFTQDNTTAYPQTKIAHQSVTLKKNQKVVSTTLELPKLDPCKTSQTDIYYGDEQVSVGKYGTAKLIQRNDRPSEWYGYIYAKNPSACSPLLATPDKPPVAITHVTPVVPENVTPATPHAEHSVLPVSIPSTGSYGPVGLISTPAAAFIVYSLGMYVQSIRQKYRN